MDKSTFVFSLVLITWLAFIFNIITDHTASQIILIMFILFVLIQLGIIEEE